MNTTNGIVGHADILCLIEASSRANVNYASLNVTLTGTFLIEARDQRAQDGLHYSPINFSLRQLPQFLDINGSVVLEPSGFCLASFSVEKSNCPIAMSLTCCCIPKLHAWVSAASWQAGMTREDLSLQ